MSGHGPDERQAKLDGMWASLRDWWESLDEDDRRERPLVIAVTDMPDWIKQLAATALSWLEPATAQRSLFAVEQPSLF